MNAVKGSRCEEQDVDEVSDNECFLSHANISVVKAPGG